MQVTTMVLMMVWTVVSSGKPDFPVSVAMTQTGTVVSASFCEVARGKMAATARKVSPKLNVEITVDCIPIDK